MRLLARMRSAGSRTATAGIAAAVVAAGMTFSAALPALAAGPVITSFAPGSGAIGASVTITGSGFVGATQVDFGDPAAAAPFSVVSATQINATVPANASTGKITVTAPGGTASSLLKFNVSPSIILSAQGGHPANTVAVTGAGFKPFEAVDLYFDSTDETLAVTSGTGTFSGIILAVPAAAAPGTHWVTAVGRVNGPAAQAAYAVSTDWSQFGWGSRHKRWNPYENVLSTANVALIDRDWAFTTQGPVLSSPAVAGGTVYIASTDGNVYALDAGSGSLLWSFPTGGAISSSPAVAGGAVYIGSNDGKVYALDAASGSLLWSFPTGGAISSSPVVAGGVVYIGSTDSKVYALDAGSGTQLWSFTTGGAVNSSPAVDGGQVYVGSSDDSLYALNSATGAKLWAVTTNSPVNTSPAVAYGEVYFSAGSTVYAVNPSNNGGLIWSSSVPAPSITSSPAVANRVVYVGAGNGSLYAINAINGKGMWGYDSGGPIESTPALANGVAYYGSDSGYVFAIDPATPVELWRFATGNIVTSSPAVVNGAVYIGSNDGKVYAFDLDGGTGAAARPAITSLHPNPALRPQVAARSTDRSGPLCQHGSHRMAAPAAPVRLTSLPHRSWRPYRAAIALPLGSDPSAARFAIAHSHG